MTTLAIALYTFRETEAKVKVRQLGRGNDLREGRSETRDGIFGSCTLCLVAAALYLDNPNKIERSWSKS
ncbi:hypothetical protein SCA6_007818 [Theobroma cacao]